MMFLFKYFFLLQLVCLVPTLVWSGRLGNSLTQKCCNCTHILKKNLAMEKDYGRGSWETGYEIPDILIGKSESSLNSEASATIYPLKLENPTTDNEKVSLCFTLDRKKQVIGDTLQKISYKVGTSFTWCIPYRYFTSNFRYVNVGTGKYIEADMQVDDSSTYNLRINMPWGKGSSVIITEQQIFKLIEIVNNSINNIRANVINTKQRIRGCADEYKIKMSLVDGVDNEESFKAKINSLNKELIDLNSSLETTLTEFKQYKAIYDENSLTEIVLEQELNNNKTKLTNLANEKISLENSLKELEAQTQSSNDTARLQKEADNALTKFNEEIKVLNSKAPDKKNVISKAEDANSNLNYPEVEKIIDSIVS